MQFRFFIDRLATNGKSIDVGVQLQLHYLFIFSIETMST